MKVPNSLKVLLILGFIGLLGACSSSHMTRLSPGEQTNGPEPGKALINFMRPSSFGGAIQSTLYDGDTYIGTISANTRLCYQAEPGQHLFMIVGESADFMQANLLPNKTYYVNVAPRPGFLKSRFSLRPMNGQVPQDKIDKWVRATKEVKVNEKGKLWANQNAASVQNQKKKYLPKWNQKSEKDKQTLHPESGK